MTIAACSIVTSPPPPQPPTTDNNNSNIDKNIDKLPRQNKNQDIENMSSEAKNTPHSRGRNKASESSDDSESSGLGGSQKDHALNTDDESETIDTINVHLNNEDNKNVTKFLGKISEESEKKGINKEVNEYDECKNGNNQCDSSRKKNEYVDEEDEQEEGEEEDATQETQIIYDEYDGIFDDKEIYHSNDGNDKKVTDEKESCSGIDSVMYEDISANEDYSTDDERRSSKLKIIYENDVNNHDNNEEEISNDENIDPDNNNHQNENISNREEELLNDEEDINNRSQNNSAMAYSNDEVPRYSNERLVSDNNYGTPSIKSQRQQPPPEGTYINGVWIPNSRLSHLQQMTFNGLQFQPIPGFPQYLVPPPVQMMPQMVTQVSPQSINSQQLQTMTSESTPNSQNPLSTIPSLQAFVMPQHLYPYFVDNRFSDFRNIIATGPTTINAPIPSEEGYDLFLHLQEGESISLCVGSPDMSKLTGPISMRWVARPGVIPTALPLVVPPGHIVQQLIDERGILRHMILSPDSQIYHNEKEKNNNIPNTSSSNNNNIILNCNNTKQQLNSNINNSNINSNGMLRPRSHTTSIHYNKGGDRNSPSDGGQRNINYHGKNNRMSPGVNNFTGNNIKNHNNNMASSSNRPQQQNNYHHPNAGHSGGGNQNTRYNSSHTKQHQQYDNYSQNNNNHKNITFEPYEIEYLHQVLSSINPPQLIRCGSREAEISWNEIDIKELSLHNNISTSINIEPSEFAYEVFLYEHSESGRLILNQTADRNQFKMKLLKLKPFTNYWVNMRVALIDRDIYGSPSKYLSFKTNPSVPDAPSSVKCISKSATWVQITWKYPNNNGSQITNFIVQFAKNKLDPFDKVWEGLSDTCKITDLEPSSSYRVRIIAVNSEGNSEPSLMIPVNTYAVHKNTTPSKPPNLPTVIEVGAEKVKIRWDENQNTNDNKGNYVNSKNSQSHSSLIYTLEMCEVNDKVISKLTTVPKHKYIFNTAVVDVLPDKEYQFRIAVSHPNGNCVRSDWVTVHTPSKDGNVERFSDIAPKGIVFMPTPINLKRLRTLENDAIEIGWQYTGKEDVYYILEGCYSTDCINWKVIYNGKMNSYVNKDTKLSAFRVRAINGDEHSSAWSEVMFAVRKNISNDKNFGINNDSHSTTVGKPPCSTQPKFSNITSNSVKISWKLVFFNSPKNDECTINDNNSNTPHYSINSFIASNTPVFYELQRVDTTPIIIYSGDVPEYTLEKLNAMEHLQVRVRAVAIDKMGVRNEGDWSCVASCCTLSSLPSKPLNLKIQTVSGALGQNKCGVKLLIWNQPSEMNGCEIIEYKIYKFQEEINENNTVDKVNRHFEYFSSTVDTNLMLDNLIANQRYVFTVTAFTNLGESEHSDHVEFITEQSVPFPPTSFDIIDITTNSFEVIWKEPKMKSNEITKYCLEIYNGNKCESLKAVRDGETIPMEIFYTEPDINNKIITDLKPETPYYVKLYGISKTGKGIEVIKLINTLPKPPVPPNLTVLLAASNFLKIKINASNDINYFSLEQEIEGDFEEIYHGELRTVKAKNLEENTFYNFRVRAAFNQSHQYGDYSSTYTFKTSHTPPPQLKASPTITEISQGTFNIEWPHVKMIGLQDNDDIICYRLQITNRFGKEKNGEPWKTIYEGTNNSFIYETDNGSLVYSKQIRIIVIKFVDGIEVQSLPSPIFNFKPILTHSIPDSPRKRNCNNGKVDDSNASTTSTSPTKINKSMIGSSKRRWWIVNFCRRHARDIKMGVLCIILAFVAICIISAFFTRMTSGK
uniref:Fibronectin type-III domain-containing protein n=1 Tax=Strongyloides papillosus TaxID=174720 RepID=A0A0N5C8U1_STREA